MRIADYLAGKEECALTEQPGSAGSNRNTSRANSAALFGGLNDDPRLAMSRAGVGPHRLLTCRLGRIFLFSYMGVIRMACVTGPFHENKQHLIQV
ncbi:hypothetical protein D3P04_02210 [Paracoccus onubensis]|uniref:Uncharacterized protein n=1 Tax=Paracoccus onubensis TaxID=1675788 RepID=A0A418T898_9RHOB|nr:hypothetical protein D3P04_02210 [Paracoccus onubensis]